jgi:hypothetical protein
MMDRRVLLIVCILSLTLAQSAVLAQGGAAPNAKAVNSAKAKDSVAVKDSSAAKKPGAAKVIDLDKLLVADEEGDLLIEEKPAVHKPANDSAVVGQAPAKAEGQLADDGDGAKSADSAAQASAPTPPGRRGPPPAGATEPDAAETGPAIVEEGRTINFAQNLKEYRSPRVAMLLSLLVPGLGQAYSRNYVKTAAFGAAEVAAIGVAVYLNSVAKSKKADAHKFADSHFGVDRIRNYDKELRDAFFSRDTVNEIEKDSLPLPYDQYFYEAAGKKSSYYYESIRGKDFTPGWEDRNLSLGDILSRGETDTILGTDGSGYMFYAYNNGDMFYYVKRIFDGAGRSVSNGEPVLGHSSYQAQYNTMVDRSNSYRDAVNYMFYVIILNHIASAVDAGFTARAYNARLLGEDDSAWNRISVEQQFVFTGSELSPGIALRLRF